MMMAPTKEEDTVVKILRGVVPTLVTHNTTRFENIPNLPLEDWLAP
jgi:hypothetical protein